MGWTDATTVKLHLQAFSVDALAVPFHPVVFEGTEAVQLPHNTLAEGSVRVHAMLADNPVGPLELTLSGSSYSPLGYDACMPSSVVVAADDPPMIRYVEGLDYAVDDGSAKIKRLEGGAIPSGATVQVWLLPLTPFTEDIDFDVEHAEGLISRTAVSDLPDPARVLVSYSTSASGASGALIGQAIKEAESKITDRLRDGFDASSSDDGLVIGATELTIAILCDDLALRSLTGVGDNSADDRAKRFMELAVRYHERATSTLSRYLKAPLPASATVQSNSAPAGW
jgi:hypothetical protein